MDEADAELFDDGPLRVDAAPLIQAVHVKNLFGRYTYHLIRPEVDGQPSRLMLLHGDNGSGKTTLLQILWHLLSPAENRGHRSAVAKIPFEVFRVDLATGHALEVKKTEGLAGPYTITIFADDQLVVEAKYSVDQDLDVLPVTWPYSASFDRATTALLGFVQPSQQLSLLPDERAQVLTLVQSLEAMPYLLADDRNLHSDEFETTRERETRRTGEEHLSPSQRWQLAVSRELTFTLRRVNEWFRQMTLGAQTVGSEGANSIYMKVLNELAQGDPDAAEDGPNELQDVRDTLNQVAEKAPRFAEFGLVPAFQADSFRSLLERVPSNREELAAKIVFPYLDSLRARYEALDEAERLIRLLLTHANGFLNDKRLSFTPRQGLRILTDHEEVALEPTQLSSGERQLVLLLCTTLLARRHSRVFIIDEPELSLSVPWQRRVLESLLACTEGAPVQFLVATHSVEMVTGNRQSLVRLDRSNGER